jgi:phosphoglycolate phosphatase-like HAD superfamily hydrolase
MGQHGSDTTIADTARLIVFDCYETLVHMDRRRYLPRRGVVALLLHLRRSHRQLVVLSDGEREGVLKALAEAELDGFIDAVYGVAEGCQRLADGRIVKRLDVPMQAHGVTAAQTVFIGDSQLDSLAAQQFMVPFIRVPRSEDVSFSFARLIGGSSRYSSEIFSQVIDERYRRKDG